MKMFRRISALFLAVASAFAVTAAESATQLLARCADKLTTAPSVTAEFSIRGADGEDVSGTIVMARERFRMISPQLNIWFDGRTQWSALAAVKEVNVTEPAAEELLSSNPFAIITDYSRSYNCRLLPVEGGRKTVVRQVELTPKRAGADIRRAVVSIDTRTLWPVKAIVTMASGSTVNATISKCTIGKKLPVSAFTFSPSALPGYELVDLR